MAVKGRVVTEGSSGGPAQRLIIPLDESVDAYKAFAKLPYKSAPFDARNWGHSLHFLCSYQSKLKPSIAHFLVRYFTEPGQTVLDPFSGVGTIPFEACLQGRVGIGVDINPVAFYNTRAKVDPPSLRTCMDQIDELDRFIRTTKLAGEDAQVDDFTRRFYHPRTLTEILKARSFFLGKGEDATQYSLIIASLLHLLHGNRPYALSRRSHGLTPLAPSGEFVYKPLTKHLRAKVKRALDTPLPPRFVRGNAFWKSSLHLPLPGSCADAIITSPPFLGSTRFFANNRIRFWFCGWDYRFQNGVKNEFLEAIQVSKIEVYNDIFKEFARVLKPEAVCILHLGVVKGNDMGDLLLPFAIDHGFEQVNRLYEDAEDLETHGMTDQGVTHRHEFVFLKLR